jgi:hypothetical protein
MFKTCEMRGTIELTEDDVDIIFFALNAYKNSFDFKVEKDRIAKVQRKIRIMELLEGKGND